MQVWNKIDLIAYEDGEGLDEYGDKVIVQVRRPVFAECKSITQTEFYQAQSVGLKPQIKFHLATSWDYKGEEEVAFNGVIYKVQRTYILENDSIDIVCYGGVRDEHTEDSNQSS